MLVTALFLALAALISAAPHTNFRRSNFEDYFSDEDQVFDTSKFWKDMNDRLLVLDDIFEDLYKHFPQNQPTYTQGVSGNKYIVTVPLTGFEEKDISVKAHKGLMLIEATHKGADVVDKAYLDIRILPSDVDPVGKWTFEQHVLKITFPLEGKETTTDDKTTMVTTEVIAHSREEMEPHGRRDDQDADVGVGRFNTEHELMTNEIDSGNPVEATSHKSKLNNEAEWVVY